MTDNPWTYEKLARRPELKYLPPFIYGNYYAFLHWGDGTLNGHWINTQSEEEFIEFSMYLNDQFPDIIKFDEDGWICSVSAAAALKQTNEEQQVFLKMRWAVE